MSTTTLEFAINTETETEAVEIFAVYSTEKTETTFTFPVDLEPKHVAGCTSPFNRVKAIKSLLTELNPDITGKEIETFLDSKFAIERAKAKLAIADESLDVSYMERARKDGSIVRTIKANDKVLTKADMKRMLEAKDEIISQLQERLNG